METEIWKDIPGYEGLYMASTYGRIKSLVKNGNNTEKILKSWKSSSGYYCASMRRNSITKTYLTHRVIASAFLGLDLYNKMRGTVVMHLDNNGYNNNLENLKLGTQSENTLQSIVDGTGYQYKRKGAEHARAKLCNNDVLKIRELSKTITNKKISKLFNISEAQLSGIINRKYWTHI